MADYITKAQLQAYGSFKGVAGEAILDLVIPAACEMIDLYCGRTFAAAAETDRKFTRLGLESDALQGRTLYLDEDLAQAPSAITGMVVATDVAYLPENKPPYYAIVLIAGSWAHPTITVTGYWAYSKTTPPSDIVIAALQLAKWMYDQRETGEGTNVLITPEGQVLLPSGLPSFIKLMLDPYRKIRMA